MNYKSFNLENGLRVVILDGMHNDAVTIGAYVKSGFKYDPVDKNGLSHFTEHMIFNGTKNYPTPGEVALATERYGGWHSAFTWIDYQKHIVHLPKDHFDVGIKVLFDTLGKPLIKKSQISREKSVIKEEILTNKSDPAKAIWDYGWFPLFFANTSIARPYTGDGKDIDNILCKDILNFTKRYFNPNNMVLLVAGDLDEDYIKEKIYELSSDFKNKYNVKKVKLELDNKKKIFSFVDNSYYQTSLAIGFKTVSSKSGDKYVFDIIKDLLAGYFGTKLIQRLRDKGGLIYTWNVFQDNLEDLGYFVFNVSVSPKNVKEVCTIILEEFKRINKGNFDEKELLIAKSHLMGSILANNQTGLDYINHFGPQELINPENVRSIGEVINIYNNIDIDLIKGVAKNFLRREDIFIASIGSTKEQELMVV